MTGAVKGVKDSLPDAGKTWNQGVNLLAITQRNITGRLPHAKVPF